MPSRTPPVDPSARWSCPDCTFKHEPGSPCPRPARWAGGGTAARPGLAWIIRPMPPDQWPPEQHLPRDNTFRWWVKASCGHPGGHRQFAFYEKRYADEYEWVFRENPCYWTRCRSRRG